MYTIIENEPLSRHTSYAIGGPARWFVRVTDASDLPEIVRWILEKRVPWYVLGGGSNILIGDSGYDGLVIRMDDRSVAFDGERVIAAAGAPTAMVVNACIQQGLAGFEWAFGIPGTIGGAVRGNAGAFGSSISDLLEYADVIDPKTGAIERMSNSDFHFRYRWSFLAERRRIILRAGFHLTESTKGACKEILDRHLASKRNTQPLGSHCAGCTFKNIVEADVTIYAGKLVDGVGLKGTMCGDAQISEKHANFIINRGHASARDIESLIALAKTSVKKKFGVELEEEIRFLGNNRITY